MKKSIPEMCQQLCNEIDKFAEIELTPGTPLHKLQQCLKNSAEIYAEIYRNKEDNQTQIKG